MNVESPLDTRTATLVRFAAAVAGGRESELRDAAERAIASEVPAAWVDELILQSVLMVGYPRALMAMATWRAMSGVAAPPADAESDYGRLADWEARGAEVCRTVYGKNYLKLRENVRRLHPALDCWMVTEGYGRTIGRPGLDLVARELCTVAQTAVLNAPRQLHSHLIGARHAGASDDQIDAALALVGRHLDRELWQEVKELWHAVRDSSPGDGD